MRSASFIGKIEFANKLARLKRQINLRREVLKKWRLSNNRRKWERAVVILDTHNQVPLTVLENKIERSRRKIIEWIKLYIERALDTILISNYKSNPDKQQAIKQKKKRLIKLIHQTPAIHGINRSSWSLECLAKVYRILYRESVSRTMISKYIRSEGYSFRKAKKVLSRLPMVNMLNFKPKSAGRSTIFTINTTGIVTIIVTTDKLIFTWGF